MGMSLVEFRYSRPRLLWEVPHQALQYGPGDVLFELGFAHGGTVDPAVAAFPRLLVSLEDACLPHGFEEVDYAGAADGLALEPRVNPIPHRTGAEALRAHHRQRVGRRFRLLEESASGRVKKGGLVTLSPIW